MPAMPTVAEHVAQVAADGYTILTDAIERPWPSWVAASTAWA